MTEYSVALSKCILKEKLQPGDPMWSEFNGSFVNYELDPRALMANVYTGRAMTTHHKNNWRTTENFIKGQHIGMDFDSEDDTSRLSTLVNDKFISKYSSFAHTTISHTDEKPRARVVFLLDEPIYQAKNYALAASALLWLFGTADTKCKDAARFFYGSPGCKYEYINKVLPLDVVKKLIANYIESGTNERKQSTQQNYLPPATQQDVASALDLIDPWKIEYDEWVSVLMAIHSQFGDGGYMLADSWAAGKTGEVEHKWKSFKQDGNPSGQVTIATVFGIAKRFGWTRQGI